MFFHWKETQQQNIVTNIRDHYVTRAHTYTPKRLARNNQHPHHQKSQKQEKNTERKKIPEHHHPLLGEQKKDTFKYYSYPHQ
jgi:hypothetical protein